MRKNQKNNHGTASSTRRTRSQNKANRTNSNTETISKFFKKADNGDKTNHNQSIYKDAVTEIGETPQFNSSNVSDVDQEFVSIKPAKKVAEIFTQVKEARVKRSSRLKNIAVKKPVANETKKLIHIGKTSDVNVEHLQLAMALSKSMEPELSAINNDEEDVYPSTQQITENARLELLGYRFKSLQSTSQKLKINENLKSVTNRKKSKFRYVKPKLFTTTNEERQKIIQKKVEEILSFTVAKCSVDENIQPVLHSFILQDNVNEKKKVFYLSQQIEKEIDDYYVDALELEKSKAACGYLLKNWDIIAGRDKSPQKNTQKEKEASVEEHCMQIDKSPQENRQEEKETIVEEYNKEMDMDLSQNNSSQNTFVTAKSCSSYFSSVSQMTQKLIRSDSPDLFASSDEDVDMLEDNVFTKSTTQSINSKQYDEPTTHNSVNYNLNFKDKENNAENVEIADENQQIFDGLSRNDASHSLLGNINKLKEPNKGEVPKQINIDHKTNETVEIQEEEIVNCHVTTFSAKKFQNCASASFLSNINAQNLNKSDANFNDSDQNYEVDDNGICTYESFCDYDEPNFDQSVHSAASETEDNINELTNKKTIERIAKQTNAGGVASSNIDKYPALKASNQEIDENNESTFNHSHISPNLASQYANVTHHVQALLNSESFVNDLKSICIEKYFNRSKKVDENPDKLSPIKNACREVNKDEGDLSQAKIVANTLESDECIDLSQDSDNDDDSDHLQTNMSRTEPSLQRHLSTVSMDSTMSTNDSICISDEELNYSCLNATPKPKPQNTWQFERLAFKKNKFAISDSEDEDADVNVTDNKMEESINVTRILAAIQERKCKEHQDSLNKLNTSGIVNLEDDEDSENDSELQEALRLSAIEAEKEEKRRLSQETPENTEKQNSSLTTFIQNNDHEFSDSFPLLNCDISINIPKRDENHEKQDLQSSISINPADLNVENDFADSFPVLVDDIDKNVTENNSDENFPKNDENNEKQDMETSIPIETGYFNDENDFGDSFPSINDGFDHSNLIKETNDEINDTNIQIIGVTPEISDDETEINKDLADCNFPSFDYDNFDHRGNNTIEVEISKPIKEPDEFDLLIENESIFNRLSNNAKPQCRRVQELIGENQTSGKQSNTSRSSPNKRASETFEDTLANLLENTKALQNLDRIENIQLKTPNDENKSNNILNSSSKQNSATFITPGTPADGLYVKTSNVTPMPMFDKMTTPEIHLELDKIGVKRMKRRRGVQMLKYVYNSMHVPLEKQLVIENVEYPEIDIDNFERPSKRRKKLNYDDDAIEEVDAIDVNHARQIEILHSLQAPMQGNIEINRKLTECEPLEDLIFERTQSKRIKSCALPFHIAWHNFLCVNREIWENVLLYEPLQVEVIYAMFKELGFKYHIQDMITFFDKKCITIRIKQNN